MLVMTRESTRGPRSILLGSVMALVCGGALVGNPRTSRATDEGRPNACGCHQTAVGQCVCDKKARCGCPGECEPRGCEDKRAKLLEKEIQAETKKAQDADRKREGNTREQSSSGRSEPEKPPVREARAVAHGKKLTAAQKRELSHLLEVYVGENPARRGWTIEKLVDDLTP